MHHRFRVPASVNRAAALALALATAAWCHDMETDMPGGPNGPGIPIGDSLPALVATALRNNPGIKAAASRVKSLHSSPAHTWYLEPPEVGVEFYQAPVRSFPNPLKDQMEVDYSVRQTFPFPGKIGTRIEVEHRHAEMGEAELDGARRRIVRQVKTAYYELYLLDRRLETNRENRILVTRFVEVSRRQYEVGLGRQADILRAQGELTQLQADSIALTQARESGQAMLNALLARDMECPVPIPAAIAPGEADWTLAQVRPILEKNHPGLLALRSAIRMRKAGIEAARKEYLPDFMVGGSYKNTLEAPPGTHGGGLQDYWSMMVSMKVPLAFWSLPAYKAGLVQGRADLEQAEMEYADMSNMLLARAREALLKAKSGRELLRLSRNVLLPQSQQALESNQAAYQGGKSEFTNLLDAYRMRAMARENSEMALMRLLASQAELEEAVGLSLAEIRTEMTRGAAE